MIRQLIDLVKGVKSLADKTPKEAAKSVIENAGRAVQPFFEGKSPLIGPLPVTPTPTLPPSTSASAGTVSIGQVAVGDINIHAPNADPVAVGDQVRKVFHEELGNTLRKTMDAYG